MLHSDRSALKRVSFHFVDLGGSLVPLERVQAVDPGRPKTVFRVEVYAQARFNQVGEFPHNLVGILVEKALQLGNRLIVIKVLFVLSI